MPDPSDEVLMQRVREGDVETLGVLFDRHNARVLAVCFRLCESRDVADDLAQETWVRVLRFAHSFRGDSTFATWLYRIACNVCSDENRRTAATVPQSDVMHDHAQRLTLLAAGTMSNAVDERHARLEEALKQLSAEHRQVLVLSRYLDLNYSAIADLLGSTAAAVRVRAHRALNELREIYHALERRDLGLRSSAPRNR